MAVRYAQRKPDPYEGGQYDVVFCDGGKVNTYAQAGVRRIVVVKGDGAPEMPKGYWAYRATAAHTVYTCDPADAEPALPGLLAQARNLAVSLVTGGLSASTPELMEVRRAICASNGGVCPTAKRRLSDNRCSECGCALEYKIALAGQKCPDGHW